MRVRLVFVAGLLAACSDVPDDAVLPHIPDARAIDPGDAQSPLDATLDAGPDAATTGDASVDAGPPSLLVIDGCTADNAAALSPDEVARLRAANDAPELPWLYPLPGTVMPRGLRAPLLMWTGGAAPRAVLVRIRASTFEYEGCLRTSADGRVVIPADVWTRASERGFGKSDPFTLEVRELDTAGRVRGRSTSSLIIAPGSLKGSLYYNSYSSRLAVDAGATGGAVLRVRAGADAEVFAGQRGCVGCHSVSANGNRLVASNLGDQVNAEGVYALTPDTPVNPPSVRAGTDFVGLTPDGSLYATGRSGYDSTLPGLYETDTGRAIASATLPVGTMHPTFSASGGMLAFVDTVITPEGNPLPPVIATLNYDARARSFGGYSERVAIDGGSPDWPSFLPDDHALIYTDIARPRLFLHDLEGDRDIQLWRAMGYASLGEAEADTFTPDAYGVPAGQHAAYYPTVAPVAVGGYFWVFFDTYRNYGNVSSYVPYNPSEPPPQPPIDPPDNGLPDWLDDWLNGGSGGAPPAPPPPDPGVPTDPYTPPSRQIWGAAIEVSADGRYTTDPSHPPFYLDGQELGTNNHRAFAALDPCSARGSSCTSGIDCCDGFCEQNVCVAPPNRCAMSEEACAGNGDCCDTSDRCINGFCSFVDVLK